MKEESDYFRMFMPYCIKQIEDGRHVVLNRFYKPLGHPSGVWVVYEDYAVDISPKVGSKRMEKIAVKADDGIAFFYDSSCHPLLSAKYMNAYLQRLSALKKFKVR